MRKALLLFTLFLAAGIAVICCARARLSAAQDDVSLTPVNSRGDESAADGLTVSVRAELQNRLLWDTDYSFGSPNVTTTDFSYSNSRRYFHMNFKEKELILDILPVYHPAASGSNLLDEEGEFGFYSPYNAVFRDIASRTQNGVSHEERVLIKDYFDFYPISASIRASGYYFPLSSEEYEGYSMMPEDAEASRAISDFIKIPVPEELTMTATIYKDSKGDVVQVSSSHEPIVYIYALSVGTEDGVYFTLNVNGDIDYSNIPGGLGIYLIPASSLTAQDGSIYPTLDYNRIENVLPLSNSSLILSFELSEDESCLNLIFIEGEKLLLSVVDIASMTEIGRLVLAENAHNGDYDAAYYSDDLLLVSIRHLSFVLAERQADNTYRVVLEAARDDEIYSDSYPAIDWFKMQFAWNGEKLAIVSRMRSVVPVGDVMLSVYDRGSCGFLLEVFDKDGLRYISCYESSLDALSPDLSGDRICRLTEADGLRVSWQ